MANAVLDLVEGLVALSFLVVLFPSGHVSIYQECVLKYDDEVLWHHPVQPQVNWELVI